LQIINAWVNISHVGMKVARSMFGVHGNGAPAQSTNVVNPMISCDRKMKTLESGGSKSKQGM
jgi:hypothetical protein